VDAFDDFPDDAQLVDFSCIKEFQQQQEHFSQTGYAVM
jgi:hypothetical protein